MNTRIIITYQQQIACVIIYEIKTKQNMNQSVIKNILKNEASSLNFHSFCQLKQFYLKVIYFFTLTMSTSSCSSGFNWTMELAWNWCICCCRGEIWNRKKQKNKKNRISIHDSFMNRIMIKIKRRSFMFIKSWDFSLDKKNTNNTGKTW